MKSREKDPLLRTIMSDVLIAVIPAVLAYIVSFIDGRRREELTYVNSQIEKSYGPSTLSPRHTRLRGTSS